MAQCSRAVMDAIETAMTAEEKARNFYADAAGRVNSVRGKQLFQQLADFEQGHYDILARLKESLAGKGCYVEYAGTSFAPVYAEGEDLTIGDAEKKDINEILTMAIGNEKKAGDAYSRLAAQVDDPDGVAMFRKLADEESHHARILEDQFYDINNKGMWTWDA
ncbi:MAG: ferritin family protein [Deltaproteobacteria bacterium]|nr:ferritin family protein [Candidatus Anaeroferrophillacea bacterium]